MRINQTAHKKLIKYRIVKKQGKDTIPTLDGMCGWHPGKKQLVLWEMDHEGNLTESIVIPGANKVSYEELLYMTDGNAFHTC